VERDEPPIEWIPGLSRAPWLIGFELAFVLGLIGFYELLFWGLMGIGVQVVSPAYIFALDLVAIPLADALGMLWLVLVPYPATRLGVSPSGVIVYAKLLSARYSWDKVLLNGNRMVGVSRRFGIPQSYSLTPFQASRVASLRPGPSR